MAVAAVTCLVALGCGSAQPTRSTVAPGDFAPQSSAGDSAPDQSVSDSATESSSASRSATPATSAASGGAGQKTGATTAAARRAAGTVAAPGTARPFAADSPFNIPIAAHPKLDSQSAGIIRQFTTGNHGLAIFEFGVPVYYATAATPRRPVPCRITEWGPCPTSGSVPMPPGAKASPGSDGAMVVVDTVRKMVYEYWQYNGSTASWSQKQSLVGKGNNGGAVGAGVSRLAGLIREDEVKRGVIDHALVFSSNMSCPGKFRYPATKTDGRNLTGDQPCLVEGTRLQLDPSINVAALPGLSRGERMVARALQQYGAYHIDNGGARMAIIAQTPTTSPDPFQAAGLKEYSNLKIPWNRMRVLATWNGK